MAKKRSNHEGSLYKRSDGRWEGKVLIGYEHGRPKYKYVTRATQQEARAAWERLKREHAAGGVVNPERQTVEQFLTRWLDDVVKPKLRPTTLEIYGHHVRRITKHVGHVQLTKLTAQHVQGVLNALRAEGLGPATVDRARDVLSNALNVAVRWKLCSDNVAMAVDKPKVDDYEPRVLTMQESQRLIAAAQGSPLEPLWMLAATLGLRRGEMLGLRWRDIDFDEQVIHIRVNLQMIDGRPQLVKPKTKESQRDLPLLPELETVLRLHKAKQLETKMKAGSLWQEHGLVFCTRIGTPVAPRNLLRDFKALLEQAALPDMRIHDLRHSALSLLAAKGVHPRVTQAIAGHADVRTTLNIYTHVTPEQKAEAAALLASLFTAEEKETGS